MNEQFGDGGALGLEKRSAFGLDYLLTYFVRFIVDLVLLLQGLLGVGRGFGLRGFSPPEPAGRIKRGAH